MQNHSFRFEVERFDDFRILRYQVPGFENLSLNLKLNIYYLSQAALWGRDILWDQNYKHNLLIRKTIEKIILDFKGDRNTIEYQHFITYSKKVFFANGIHHHYSMDKFYPECTKEYFAFLLNEVKLGDFLETFQPNTNNDYLLQIIYSENDIKRVSLDTNGDLILDSACNYYEAVNQKEAEDFHENQPGKKSSRISHGLNSTLIKRDGVVFEDVWKINGKYHNCIAKMIFWLKKAIEINPYAEQKTALENLVSFYETGDLEKFDDYSISWLSDVKSPLDIIHGFIEVYGDPLGRKASYESVISIRDEEATQRAETISKNAIWFEQNSSTDSKFKKDKIDGVHARAVHVVMEAGDCSPATPIGINLPNADWIRAEYGSKSITISNIIDAYDEASKGNGSIEEFAYSPQEIEIHNQYSAPASKLHVDLHEIVGHGSGKLAEGVADPATTLKSYASTIEEARADLVALYFALDQQLIEWNLMPSKDAGICEYNSYIRSGLMTQLVRVQLGKNIEESHMRNRQLIAQWAYDSGKKDGVIEKIRRDNKTYFVIHDYYKLQILFGELLREVQRIKSEGDYESAQKLVENFGVKVDYELHKEVLKRWKKINIPPYSGFLNPHYEPKVENGQIIDISIHYADNFLDQMIHYGKTYSFN
jgi:dipeptidyl-peptidase-3